ncbi:hypothetical protein M3Y97_00885500 [Aphelenchoides bicaudatus]|nr:hypothetical protein M3Y97_00885500 [Aphelenchoides bicaudatus]
MSSSLHFVHCNFCGKQPKNGMKFYMASCGHVSCNFCNEKGVNQPKCHKCQRQTTVQEIGPRMKGKEFFMDQRKMLEKISDNLEQIEKQYGNLPVLKEDKTYTARNEELSELYAEADKAIAESTKSIENMTKAYVYLDKLMKSQQPRQN